MRARLALVSLLVAAPALAQPAPASPKRPAEAMLNALKAAPNEDAAAAIEAQLRSIWLDAASPAIKLLFARGQRELSEGAANDSFDSYDAALDLDGDLVEAWRGRAAARARMGDPQGAVRDLQEVIKREPRSFAAWQDLSHVAETRGDWRGAYAAWQKLLDIDPHTPGGQIRLRDLRRRAVGEDT